MCYIRHIQNILINMSYIFRYSKYEHWQTDGELNGSDAISLFLAARDGDLAKMSFILDNGVIGLANICLAERYGDGDIISTTLTEYLYACSKVGSNAVEGIKLLVEHGADISITLSSEGGDDISAAMHKAIRFDMLDVVWYLLALGTPCPMVHFCRSVEMIQILMLHGADVQARGYSNKTLLFTTETNQEKKRKILEFALSHGVDINAVDKFGRTALMWAAMNGNVPTVRYLCDSGARLDIKDEEQRTALGCLLHNWPDAFGKETYQILRDEPLRRNKIAVAVAFSMGLHPRLGAGSRVLAFDDEILRMIMGETGLVMSEK